MITELESELVLTLGRVVVLKNLRVSHDLVPTILSSNVAAETVTWGIVFGTNFEICVGANY